MPSVRARSVLAAGLVVALALGAGAAVLFYVLQHSLLSSLDQAAAARASDIADRVDVIGESGLDRQLKLTARDDQIVQLINSADQVVASSRSGADANGDGRTGDDSPFTGLRAAPGQVEREHAGPRMLFNQQRPYLVLVRGVRHDGQDYSIIVATSFRPQRQSVLTLVRLASIGLPVLVLLVAGATWVLVSRALRPVEAIRQRVSGIGAGDLDDRVPIPPTRDEVFRLAVTMNQMLDRLQSAQAAQRQFVSDASHELRSPLATLAATLEVAGADPSGESWHDLRQVMEEETGRMAVLVENLLLLAKVDDQGIRLNRADVDLDDLLEEEAQRLRAATALQISTQIHPVRVQGDVLRLGQAIRNVVDNASRHAASRVHLSLGTHQDQAVIVVQDDGPGIPPDQRARVFERFVRLDGSRDRASGGSGLGLPIVLEIVRGHGGEAQIHDSALGTGAAVLIRLPLPADLTSADPGGQMSSNDSARSEPGVLSDPMDDGLARF